MKVAASRFLARSAVLFLVLAMASCTGGLFVDYPLFPRQTCPSCWDDLYQGSDPPRPR
ncbi:MAG: hypothetical protein IRZ04_01730 [Rhodospirillales bacterium]|nr:hypothetical protein [Rhodospirillales bacterium]